jgi:hypothetical protein
MRKMVDALRQTVKAPARGDVLRDPQHSAQDGGATARDAAGVSSRCAS